MASRGESNATSASSPRSSISDPPRPSTPSRTTPANVSASRAAALSPCSWVNRVYPRMSAMRKTRIPRATPVGLCTSRVPSTAATLSASPRKPEPRDGLAPPMPSSATSTVSSPSATPTWMATLVAFAYASREFRQHLIRRGSLPIYQPVGEALHPLSYRLERHRHQRRGQDRQSQVPVAPYGPPDPHEEDQGDDQVEDRLQRLDPQRVLNVCIAGVGELPRRKHDGDHGCDQRDGSEPFHLPPPRREQRAVGEANQERGSHQDDGRRPRRGRKGYGDESTRQVPAHCEIAVVAQWKGPTEPDGHQDPANHVPWLARQDEDRRDRKCPPSSGETARRIRLPAPAWVWWRDRRRSRPGGTTPTNRRRTTPDDGPASRSCRNLRQDRDRDLNPKPRPLAGGAVYLDRAVHGSDAIAESSKARSPRGVCAADAVVGDLHRELPIGGADPNRDRRSLRILRCVGQGLGDHEVGRGLDGGGEPVRHGALDRCRDGGSLCQRLEGRDQPPFGQDGRVDPPGELPELRQARVSCSEA